MIERQLDWVGPTTFRVDGVTFRLAVPAQKTLTDEERDALVIFKDGQHIAEYMRILSSERVRNVMEFGVFAGGSAVFLQKLWKLDKIVGIDICPERKRLVERVAALGLSDRIRFHFEVDQADATAIERIIETEFDAPSIDLIVDDASHELGLTTKTLLSSFRYLRPGGWYVIEDWAWEFRENLPPKMHHLVGLRRLVDALVRSVGERLNPSISQIILTRRLVALQRSDEPGPLQFSSIESLLREMTALT